MRWNGEQRGEGQGGVDMRQALPGFWTDMPRGDCDSFLFPGSVFQLTHDVYKPFVFAAETLSDLSM